MTVTRREKVALHVAFAAFLLCVWYGLNHTYPTGVPAPPQVIDALLLQVQNEGLVGAVADALYAIFAGFFLAAFVGIPLGLLMGLNRNAELAFDPYLNALYVTPFSALVPALIAWFGTGFQIRVLVCFFFAVFPITINMLEGAKTTPEELVEVVRSFDGSTYHLVKTVVLPHEVPYLAAGFRLGIGRAVKGLVITELLVSITGLGGILTRWSASFDMEGVFSVVMVLMLMGIVLTGLLKRVEEAVVDWDATDA